MNEEAKSLQTWRERLEHFLQEEAVCSDAGKKFTIKKGIEEAVARIREMESTLLDQQSALDAQKRTIDKQQEIINKLVVYSMAFFYFERLQGLHDALANGTEYIFHNSDAKDLRYLRDNGYIDILGIGQLRDGQDISHVVKLTPIGAYYVNLRREYEAQG